MPKKLILTGKVYGYLTVIKEHPTRNPDGKVLWECKCKCGNITLVAGTKLNPKNKKTVKSCGCLNQEISSKYKNRNANSHEYQTWHSMMKRCYNEQWGSYKNYGAKGITVCEAWHNFDNFYMDMGDKPTKEHTLDRIDYTGNYSKNNCRWATKEEQANNRSNNKYITYNGKTKTLKQWSEYLNLSYSMLKHRLNPKRQTVKKWTIEEAFTTPPIMGKGRRKRK